ncbi:protein phosphatase 2C domain-containing protein [Massilia sp. PAMC28688]|uniref:PP2C family protein-serine/threonine phosphatase n=1 Tax=Massilia sp. PAMC28688 TaxID=2861283 RepID=UPI001C62551F|nr:protein phosphatase 2C domain-containing protein [Massilia sp. PAMC28688]QYF92515.1 protein phosphatase 2C domain-containing protein [Massilia sp. PAMC28688]
MVDQVPIDLSWTRINDIGQRATNQDTVGETFRDPLACFVVADGAGGHEGGEVASRVVVDAILNAFQDNPRFGSDALLGYASSASGEVARRKLQTPRYADMSTTVATLLVDRARGQALWAHLGDTRIYLFRNARLHAMSKDHSLTQQLIDAGYARAEQLRRHPQRNILFAAIGAEGDTQIELSAGATTLLPGDALLLCSDGLWEWVMEADMERTLSQASSCEQWLAAMCRLADDNIINSGKVRDNYSAYAILVHKAGA